MDKSVIIGKRIECIIGIVFLIPSLIGVLFFWISLLNNTSNYVKGDLYFTEWSGLRSVYTWADNLQFYPSTSASPFYLGIISFVGAYLIKDSIRFFFVKINEKSTTISE